VLERELAPGGGAGEVVFSLGFTPGQGLMGVVVACAGKTTNYVYAPVILQINDGSMSAEYRQQFQADRFNVANHWLKGVTPGPSPNAPQLGQDHLPLSLLDLDTVARNGPGFLAIMNKMESDEAEPKSRFFNLDLTSRRDEQSGGSGGDPQSQIKLHLKVTWDEERGREVEVELHNFGTAFGGNACQSDSVVLAKEEFANLIKLADVIFEEAHRLNATRVSVNIPSVGKSGSALSLFKTELVKYVATRIREMGESAADPDGDPLKLRAQIASLIRGPSAKQLKSNMHIPVRIGSNKYMEAFQLSVCSGPGLESVIAQVVHELHYPQ
jgi:hypothetical protein